MTPFSSFILNIQPHEETLGLTIAVPSQLHLIEFKIEGYETTSLTILAFGGLVLHLKSFRIVNSSIDQMVANEEFLQQ
jgi:hypothetical protein